MRRSGTQTKKMWQVTSAAIMAGLLVAGPAVGLVEPVMGLSSVAAATQTPTDAAKALLQTVTDNKLGDIPMVAEMVKTLQDDLKTKADDTTLRLDSKKLATVIAVIGLDDKAAPVANETSVVDEIDNLVDLYAEQDSDLWQKGLDKYHDVVALAVTDREGALNQVDSMLQSQSFQTVQYEKNVNETAGVLRDARQQVMDKPGSVLTADLISQANELGRKIDSATKALNAANDALKQVQAAGLQMDADLVDAQNKLTDLLQKFGLKGSDVSVDDLNAQTNALLTALATAQAKQVKTEVVTVTLPAEQTQADEAAATDPRVVSDKPFRNGHPLEVGSDELQPGADADQAAKGAKEIAQRTQKSNWNLATLAVVLVALLAGGAVALKPARVHKH